MPRTFLKEEFLEIEVGPISWIQRRTRERSQHTKRTSAIACGENDSLLVELLLLPTEPSDRRRAELHGEEDHEGQLRRHRSIECEHWEHRLLGTWERDNNWQLPVGEVKRLSYEEEKEEGHPSSGEIGQEVQSPRSKQRERRMRRRVEEDQRCQRERDGNSKEETVETMIGMVELLSLLLLLVVPWPQLRRGKRDP
jgi:hypothetical protein